MGTRRPTDVITPDGSDPFSGLVTDLRNLGLTANRIPTRSTAADAQAIVDALASTPYPASVTNPVFIYRSDLQQILAYTGSASPIVVSQPPVLRQSGDISFPTIANGAGQTYGVTFPLPFASAPAVMVATTQGRWTPYRSGITTTGVTIGANNWSGATGAAGVVSWLAIGTPA